MTTLTIAQQLAAAKVALDNAQSHPQVSEALALFGYTRERIQEGVALYEAAVAASQTKQRNYGEQYSATQQMETLLEQAQKTYKGFVQVARVAFKDDVGIQTQLAIKGERKRDLAGWLEQASVFYTNALVQPQILAGFQPYNITLERLQAGQAEVKAVEVARSLQVQGKGQAQSATQSQADTLEALNSWLIDFFKIARVALQEDPQLLEMLGIMVPS